ncbi:MAG: HD domain-containing phosphohydrolase, partial [Candidatus Limnocylindrales bacterium]
MSAAAVVSALVRSAGDPAAHLLGGSWKVLAGASRSAPAAPSPTVTPRAMTAARPLSHDRRVRTGELLGALSEALDLSEGAAPGHSLRACAFAMRLADAMELSETQRESLFYAAMLKEAGSSATASAAARVTGTSDIDLKRDFGRLNPTDGLGAARFALRHMPAEAPTARARRLARLAARIDSPTRVLRSGRRERAAAIAHSLGLGRDVAEGIAGLDERWDGRGKPDGLRGSAIPVVSRVLTIADVAARSST